ncbi:hypothetical protein BC937DRAFT_91373 [Endogone sp. FLAS-F59071]|nr:hypothetical protein BC937DRAFT_91373 [Endogone sp. FLAS-F59071]|eukprot:RUS16306.1 hypothetical protein BC937DRAFT_91373 [Endogone sp. FLAS-F59071]
MDKNLLSNDMDRERILSLQFDSEFTSTMAFSTKYDPTQSVAITKQSAEGKFAAVQGFRSTRIKWKNDPKVPGKKLGMEKEEAAKQCRYNFSLDGYVLQIKFSGYSAGDSLESKIAQSLKANTTKLVVRNIPIRGNKEGSKGALQVCMLFAYGQLKSLRLLKKFTGGHCGFAFLDFTTKQEARNVYDNTASIHLYGRHLVLEWAEDGGVEALREKTSRQFAHEEGLAGHSGKRQRVDLDGNDEEMDGRMNGEDEWDD